MDFYHVLNRGVDKREIFLDDGDRARFVHGMFEFNDINHANNTARRCPSSSMNDLRSRPSTSGRTPLVQIHGWCIMGNHYHMILSELVEGGLSLFLKRLNIGHSKFFNEKYHREGTLFQGRTKKIHVNTDAHFLHILHYIHLNPLDFLEGAQEWRSGHIQSAPAALEYLDTYRWSSFFDYCGHKNFPSILTRDVFLNVFGNYREALSQYLHTIDISTIKHLTFE